MENLCITSQLVKFINVQDYVINFDNLSHITVEFVVEERVIVSSKDWIAIFPHDCDFWTSVNFNDIVTYEFLLNPPINREEKRYRMQFSLKGAKSLSCDQRYQFVYYSRDCQVLGISAPFKFRESIASKSLLMIDEKYELQRNNNEGEGDIDEGTYKCNKRGRDRKAKQNVQGELHSQKNEEEEKDEVDDVDQKPKNYMNRNRKNKLGFMNKHLSIFGKTSDSSLVTSYKTLNTSCSNCNRVGNLLNIQADLYRQVKNMAELNNDLEKQVCQLKKQLELGHAAYQKLSVTLMHERSLRHFYQAPMLDGIEYQYQPIACAYQPITVGFDFFHQAIYTVQPVLQYAPIVSKQLMVLDPVPEEIREPPLLRERQRCDEKTKLRLRAIIGNQEETIRYLTKKLAELENGRVQKVKAVVKNIENANCENPQLTTCGGEHRENK